MAILAAAVRPPSIILLDLDGTLLDASDAIVEGVLEIAAEAGLPVPTAAWARDRIGHPPEATWELLGAPDPAALVSAFSARVLPRLPGRTRVLPGVERALPALLAAGLRLAVATTRQTQSALDSLSHLGLLQHMSHVSGRDRVSRPKPAPDVLFDALAMLGGRPSEALMVGDSDADVHAAHAAGMPCWAVLGGVCSEEALRAAGADLILAGGVGELPRALGLGVAG